MHGWSRVALGPGNLSKSLTDWGRRLVIRSVVDDWPDFCLACILTTRYHPPVPARHSLFACLCSSRSCRHRGSLWVSQSPAYCLRLLGDDPRLGFCVRRRRTTELLVQSSVKDGKKNSPPFFPRRRLPARFCFQSLISFSHSRSAVGLIPVVVLSVCRSLLVRFGAMKSECVHPEEAAVETTEGSVA